MIQDAVTEKSAQEFSIHISTLRILTEPISGPLLYLLRADQPVHQYAVLLLWVVLVNLVFRSIRGGLNGRLKIEWLIGLKTLPYIVVLFVFILIVIIFAPLPVNTIQNNSPDKILVSSHSHTHWSHDGLITTKGLLDWHQKNKFDVVFITDHNHHHHTLRAEEKQENGEIENAPLIITGQEYSGTNHLALLGLERNFKTKGLLDSVVIDSTHSNNGVVIVAHWFKKQKKSLQYYVNKGVDGFEIANQAEGLSYERHIFENIKKICTDHHLLMLGAVDYHGYGASCFVWNAFQIENWEQLTPAQKKESVQSILRKRETHKINVLVYKDRWLYSRSLIGLSPFLNILGYFRTLNIWQAVSWIMWIFFSVHVRRIQLKRRSVKRKNQIPVNTKKEPFYFNKFLQTTFLIISLFILFTGFTLWQRAEIVEGFNKVYMKYGNYIFYAGLAFAIYFAASIFLSRIRKSI
jgi:histidinol phosphatase-like PHP family hydrolase